MMSNIFYAASEPVAVCPRKASRRVRWVSFWKHTQQSRACTFLASFQSSDMLCRRSVLLHSTFSKQHQGKSDEMATTDLQRSWYCCESPTFQNDDLMAYDAVCDHRIKSLYSVVLLSLSVSTQHRLSARHLSLSGHVEECLGLKTMTHSLFEWLGESDSVSSEIVVLIIAAVTRCGGTKAMCQS